MGLVRKAETLKEHAGPAKFSNLERRRSKLRDFMVEEVPWRAEKRRERGSGVRGRRRGSLRGWGRSFGGGQGPPGGTAAPRKRGLFPRVSRCRGARPRGAPSEG